MKNKPNGIAPKFLRIELGRKYTLKIGGKESTYICTSAPNGLTSVQTFGVTLTAADGNNTDLFVEIKPQYEVAYKQI